MKIAVWIVSGLLALAFLGAGGMKAFASPDALAAAAPEGYPVALMIVAGWAEVLGALGLILPAATRILPVLTPIAATGLVVTMIGAAISDILTLGGAGLPVIAVLAVLSAFVAWGRFGPAKVLPRDAAAPAPATSGA
ncbi:DoxX family protein [Myceligenerans crystallogenes]|uniref:DoxX family protein n=1 Tax=Myceligenerans crystallogenes TaxID=316335 RepID=A0ABP4ZSY4_9MICO